MQYISQENNFKTKPEILSLSSAWLGTTGAVAVFTYLAARDGGYFSMNFYPAAIASWTILGLVILLAWDNLCIAADARIAVLALGMLVIWTGLSSIWSISPNLSLQEFVRESIYLACFLAVLSGSARYRSVRLTTGLFVCITTGLASFAMLGRIFPDYSEDYIYAGGRLMGSIGYWNGLAAVMVMGIIPCLWLASSKEIPRLAKVAFSCALSLMALTLFSTLSRGGLAVCIACLFLYIIFSQDRLASLLSLFSSLLPAGLLAWYAATALPSLRAAGDGVRIDAAEGRTYAIMLIVALLTVAIFKCLTMLFPARVPENRPGTIFIFTFWIFVAASLIGITLAQRNLITEKISYLRSKTDVEVWQYDQASVDERGIERLASTSDNRTEFWRIGLANFRDHPLVGTGGGTYRFVNLRTQSGEGLARDPHSVWIRFLTDQGIIGFVLLLFMIVSLLVGVIRPLLEKHWLRRNNLYIALSITALAWIADSSFEWNWALPAITVPFFIIFGLLFRLGAAPEEDFVTDRTSHKYSDDYSDTLYSPAWLGMTFMVIAMLLTMLFTALLISRIFTDKALNDLAAGDIVLAETGARRAHKLNPYSIEPMLIQSRAAIIRGDYSEAESKFQLAIDREPERSALYEELSLVEFYYLNNTKEGIILITAAIDRDPQNDELHIILHRMIKDAAIYEDSGLMAEPPIIKEES